ncbi:lactonase family protein [Dermabacteraceae bacterium CCM 9519]
MSRKLLATCSYTESGSGPVGRGTGIDLWALDAEAATLTPCGHIAAESPSFLVWHSSEPLLYAVHETTPTRVSAYRLDGLGEGNSGFADEIGITLLREMELTGGGGSHIELDKKERHLFIANYGTGEVETVRLDADGVPVEVIDVDDHRTYGRTKVARPRQCVSTRTGSLLVTDSGLDRVFEYSQADDGRIDLENEVTLERGFGPRHIAVDRHADSFYVAGAESGTIVAVHRQGIPGVQDVDRASGHRWSARTPREATGTGKETRCSHLALSKRENFLVVANRGPDTIASFSLGGMLPDLVDEISVGGNPRHFARVKDLLVVACPEGDRIDLVRWSRDGRFEVAAEPVSCPSVVCIAPRPTQRKHRLFGDKA